LKLAPFWMILFGLAVIEKSGEGEVRVADSGNMLAEGLA